MEILKIHGIPSKKSYSEDEEARIAEILGGYEVNLPKATTHQRIQLSLLSGERFKTKLIQFAKPLLSKGAPAFLQELKSDVYHNAGKTKIVEEFLLGNLKSLNENMKFEGDAEEQDPTVQLWMLYFVSQHYYFRKNYELALEYIGKAIEHTPTVVDLYVLKAKIYKRAGNANLAS